MKIRARGLLERAPYSGGFAAIIGGLGMLATPHAFAADSPTDQTTAPAPASNADSGGLQEIIVTVRRVSENQQQVPVSVGVLTMDDLQERQITGINDLQGSVAGLYTSRTSTEASGYFTIRGITNLSLPSPSTDNGIGYYVDGVYIARGQGAGTDVPDLAQVEVLRGPQGTLFGRNSNAGAISFTTNAPTDHLEANVDLLGGSYDHYKAQAMLNLPVSSTFAIRLVYSHEQEEGDVRNRTASPGVNYGGYGASTPVTTMGAFADDSFAVRMRFKPTDALTFDYKFDYAAFVETPPANQLLGYLPGPVAPTLSEIVPLQPPGAVPASFNRMSFVDSPWQGEDPVHNTGNQLTAQYDLNEAITLKDIASYRTTTSQALSDLQGASYSIPLPPTFTTDAQLCLSCSYNHLTQHQISNESQLIGKLDNLSYIGGLYFFEETSHFTELYSSGAVIPQIPAVYTVPTVPFVNGAPGPMTLGEIGHYHNSSYAGYLHADYAFDSHWKLALGGRWTDDKRNTEDERPFSAADFSVGYRHFTYDAALNFQITPDVLVYGKWSTGYVSGGILGNIPFQPETSRQAEVGFKTEFLDHRLRFNIDGYYTWLRDVQDSVPSVDPTTNLNLAAAGYHAPFPLGILVYNLPGQSNISGMEAELTYVPVTGTTLSTNYSYNSPHNSDGSLNRAPKENVSFSTQQDFPAFANSSYLSFRFFGDYRSKYYATGGQNPAVFTGTLPANLLQGYPNSASYLDALFKASQAGNYWLLNAQLSLLDIDTGGSSKLRVSTFVHNLLDNHGLLYTVNYGFGINGSFERPRTYGAEVNWSFK